MDSDSEQPIEIFGNKMNGGHFQMHHDQQMFNQRPPNHYQQGNFNQRGRGQPRFRGNNNRGRGDFRHRGHGGHGQHFRGNGGPRHTYNGHHNNNSPQHFNSGRPQNNAQGPRTEHSPWMTPEILAMLKEKDEIQQNAFATQNQDDFRMLKALRGRLNIAINDAKVFYNEKIKDAQNMKAQGKKTALYCDPCDRAFPDEKTFQEHKDEHITCKLDGCTFTAHPKIILKHIQMQHSNDLFFRVNGYDTPEQVDKWVSERKNKFPTQENIEKKKAELLERRQRGEMMGIRNERRPRPNNKFSLDQKPQMDRNPVVQNCTQKRKRFKKRVWNTENTNGISSQNVSTIITLDAYYSNVEVNDQGELVGKSKVKWVSGKFKIKEETSDSENEEESMQITDDEDEKIYSNVNLNLPVSLRRFDTNDATVSVSNSLPDSVTTSAKPISLFGLVSYSSDSENEEKSHNVVKIEIDSNGYKSDTKSQSDERCQVFEASTSQDCKVFSKPISENDLPNPTFDYGSVKVEDIVNGDDDNNITIDNDCESHESVLEINSPKTEQKVNDNKDSLNKRRPKKDGQKKDPKISKPNFKKPALPTRRRVAFLERLLRNEINTERNYIMQACQYIEENNFFEDVPAENSAT